MASLVFNRDIVASVEHPQLIKDPFFADSSVLRSANGRLIYYGGGFSVVFPMMKDGETWAFKVWSEEIVDNRRRYMEIKRYLTNTNLPYFMDFEYVNEGILVDGLFLDTVRMRWVEGKSLVDFIGANIDNADALRQLAARFLEMTSQMHANQISHGDLHSENIYVGVGGNLLLIDYDSICVPELIGSESVCLGRKGYQHPARFSSGYLSSEKIDYFSELIIYLSILALAENRLLWDKYSVRESEYRLLFRQEDFYFFRDADIRRDLLALTPQIVELVKILDKYLATHLYIEPFHALL